MRGPNLLVCMATSPPFSEFRSFTPRKIAKFSLNFWPVRVHEKPSFRYVPSTFSAKTVVSKQYSARFPKIRNPGSFQVLMKRSLLKELIASIFLFVGGLGVYSRERKSLQRPKLLTSKTKEARKGNGFPCKGNRWPRRGTEGPLRGTEGSFNSRKRHGLQQFPLRL